MRERSARNPDRRRIASIAILVGLCILLTFAVGACSSAPSLHRDVEYGHYDAMLKHLGEGTSTSVLDAKGQTPLHAALETGKPRMALELIRHGADINARTPKGFTPLTLAVRNSHREVTNLLLERDAVIEFQSVGPSPLFEAIVANNGELFDKLIRAGARIDRKDDEGRTALHHAAEFGRLPMADRLLALGAEIDAALPDGRTALHVAVADTGARLSPRGGGRATTGFKPVFDAFCACCPRLLAIVCYINNSIHLFATRRRSGVRVARAAGRYRVPATRACA